jgi:enoyl-CoA hydratase/carnithine racemase
LYRPKALNALSDALTRELGHAFDTPEEYYGIGCIALTGSDKAFAASADIKEMQAKGCMDVYLEDFITRHWERVTLCRKPVIAADDAKLGQPEITIGIMPGADGTQRLTRFVGKKAVEMCLTGRTMDAQEAERVSLAIRIVPAAVSTCGSGRVGFDRVSQDRASVNPQQPLTDQRVAIRFRTGFTLGPAGDRLIDVLRGEPCSTGRKNPRTMTASYCRACRPAGAKGDLPGRFSPSFLQRCSSPHLSRPSRCRAPSPSCRPMPLPC